MHIHNKKTYTTIAILIAGIVVIATMWGLRRADILHLPGSESTGVVFRLFNGDTGQLIPNTKITICDDSIKYDRIAVEGEVYNGTCSEQKVWGHTTTDQEGKFSLNIKNIDVAPQNNIIVELSEDYHYSTSLSRSDTLTNHYSPSHLRVINAETPYHLVSNLIYNLDTKEVKEIFINGDPERTYTYDVIDLKVFK
ncbi:MAG: hypothetical protein V1907_03070 [Candidatus Kerfeldbacteria bacterium]